MSLDRVGLVGVLHTGNRPAARTASDIHRHVTAAIIDQRLQPATRLAEEALAESFGLGRRAVVTALDRLAWEGLVVRPRNRGAFVAAPTAADAREIFAARLAIEAAVVEAVSRNPAPAALRALRANAGEEAACRAAGRMRDAVRLSGAFHVVLAEHADNRIFRDQVRLLVARTSLVVSLFDNPGGLACWHDEHLELVDRIARRQAKSAAALMRAHLLALEESLDLDRERSGAVDLREVFRTDR